MGCATQGEKAAIIKELREKGYQLKYLLKAMHMARSTYYFELSRNDVVAERNQEILEEIKVFLLRTSAVWCKTGSPGTH